MSDKKKEYLGITENRCDFQGPVVEDPSFFDWEGDEGALLKIKTIVPEFADNNQRIENIYIVPIYVLAPAKVRIVKSYVKAGKKIKVGAYCKVWEDGTIGLVLTYMQLGGTLYKQPKEPVVPPLPAE